MNIYGTSDLHLDINPLPRDHNMRAILNKHPEDMLLLAGDTCEVRKLRNLDLAHTTYGLRSRAMLDLEAICAAYKTVVIIAGNHEFYNNAFTFTMAEFRELTQHIPNLHILDNEVLVDDKVQIIGSILWTDLNRGNAVVKETVNRHINDYFLIQKDFYRDGQFVHGRVTPEDTIKAHEECVKFLRHEIGHTKHSNVIVMVHCAPIMAHSCPPGAPSNTDYAFACTDMEDLILDNDDKVALWFHGHTHDKRATKMGQTQVVTHARGYSMKAFEPLLLQENL
jgi:predicted phosphohydrolase